ncbi:MAG: hypothetical protein H6Q18_29 [Bacteroidetes bacterium]|nr:hypothetical protein [Bacteroidota bacterium]
MNKKILYTFIILCGFLITACEDNKKEFLNDYKTILLFRNNGEVPITIYKTGVDTEYGIIVNKSGSDLKATTSVEIEQLNDAALAIYNNENGTNYVMLPANCYELKTGSKLSFSTDDSFQKYNVLFKTNEIEILSKNINYVFAAKLVNSEDSINSSKKYIFVRPTVVIPSINFETSGLISVPTITSGTETASYELAVTMPFKNLWEFSTELAIDETLLNNYNTQNKTTYKLLPVGCYQMNNSIQFSNGISLKKIPITVDVKKMGYGNFILPVKIASISNPSFVINPDKSNALIKFSYPPPKIDLAANMLSSNAVEPSEGSLAYLLDNNVATYFHSAWSIASPDIHYLQVALPTEISLLKFSYTTRQSGGGAGPKQIAISVSNDGVTFTDIGSIDGGLPTGANQSYESDVFKSATNFKYVRLSVLKNNGGGKYFVLSEFSLFGI